MSALMGKDGSIRIGATAIGSMDTWTLNPSVGSAEVTAYGNTDRQYAYSIKDWSGSAAGTLDLANAGQLSMQDQFDSAHALANVALRFYTSTEVTTYWYGNAILTDMSVRSQVADKVSVSFTFVGNGNLSYTTAGA